nr:disulfide bond formation protein B [Magnetospirillum sp. UT-4]
MSAVSHRLVALLVLAACGLALAAAYTAQYGFGLRPCELCLTQRVPFALAGGLAALALLPRFGAGARRLLVALAGLALLVNAGIAVYHVGVEQKWWASSCAGGGGSVAVDDLAAAMSRPVEVRCDEPAWAWHGITMAGLNVVFSGVLGLATLAAARRRES